MPVSSAASMMIAAPQPGVYRGAAAQLLAYPLHRVLVRAEAVGLVPAVDVREHELVVLDPGPIRLAAREPQGGVPLLEGTVAAAVVHVGMADDDLLGRPGEAGVHEDRMVLPGEEILAHKARPEVRLYTVDTG